MAESLLTPDEVAAQLGLHVRTVRNYIRDGRLPAARIGKRYRVAAADVVAFVGRPAAANRSAGCAAPGVPSAEVSSTIEIDDVSASLAVRLTNALMAAAAGYRTGDDPLHIECIHNPARARLKVVVLGNLGTSADVYRMLEALLGNTRR